MTTAFKYAVGDEVRVHFPSEPVTLGSGQSFDGVVESIRHSDYPYAVTWMHEGREVRRLCMSDWLEPTAGAVGMVDGAKTISEKKSSSFMSRFKKGAK